MVGDSVGEPVVGEREGATLGATLGARVCVGAEVVGESVGERDGEVLGEKLGARVAVGVEVEGESVGVALGEVVGVPVGVALGESVGAALGEVVGVALGLRVAVGVEVGVPVWPVTTLAFSVSSSASATHATRPPPFFMVARPRARSTRIAACPHTPCLSRQCQLSSLAHTAPTPLHRCSSLRPRGWVLPPQLPFPPRPWGFLFDAMPCGGAWKSLEPGCALARKAGAT